MNTLAKKYGLPEKLEDPIAAPQPLLDLAYKIRTQYHEDRMDEAAIRYVFVPGEESGEKIELGKAKKVGKVVKAICPADFIISLNWAMWQKLTPAQREALLDHELTHCEPKFNSKGDQTGWGIRKHDVGNFHEVIARRGCWTHELRRAGEVFSKAKQMRLFGDAEPVQKDSGKKKGEAA